MGKTGLAEQWSEGNGPDGWGNINIGMVEVACCAFIPIPYVQLMASAIFF